MVTDVRDPRNPKPVNFLAMHPKSVSMHLQQADDLLLCIQEADQRALLTQQEYYGGSGKVDSSRFGKPVSESATFPEVMSVCDPAMRKGFPEASCTARPRLNIQRKLPSLC